MIRVFQDNQLLSYFRKGGEQTSSFRRSRLSIQQLTICVTAILCINCFSILSILQKSSKSVGFENLALASILLAGLVFTQTTTLTVTNKEKEGFRESKANSFLCIAVLLSFIILTPLQFLTFF